MDERIAIAKKAVLAGGAEVLRFESRLVASRIKTTAGDLVTQADETSEATIIKTIHEAFPDELVISEETREHHDLLTVANLPNLTAWIVDPLDGTNNFKRGMHYSVISIGYVEHGAPVLGAVYDPYRRELYVGCAGQPALCNNLPVRIGAKTAFDSDTRVCTSNSYEGGTRESLARYQKLGHVWVDVLGSGIHIMTDVACGRLDLYHHNGLKPFDNPAAFAIAEGAGAKIVGLRGQAVTWLTNEIVMGNPALVDEFIRLTA